MKKYPLYNFGTNSYVKRLVHNKHTKRSVKTCRLIYAKCIAKHDGTREKYHFCGIGSTKSGSSCVHIVDNSAEFVVCCGDLGETGFLIINCIHTKLAW